MFAQPTKPPSIRTYFPFSLFIAVQLVERSLRNLTIRSSSPKVQCQEFMELFLGVKRRKLFKKREEPIFNYFLSFSIFTQCLVFSFSLFLSHSLSLLV